MPKREKSALLELLNKNHAWDLPSHKLPQVDRRRLDEAIRIQSQADDSDPWASARTRLYILQGYELASDVYREAKSRLSIRHGASGEDRNGFAVLEPLKRKAEEDRAWNQHYDQEWKEEHKR